MRKSNLRNGDLLEAQNGYLFIFISGFGGCESVLLESNGKFYVSMELYTDDLEYEPNSDYDIISVYSDILLERKINKLVKHNREDYEEVTEIDWTWTKEKSESTQIEETIKELQKQIKELQEKYNRLRV